MNLTLYTRLRPRIARRWCSTKIIGLAEKPDARTITQDYIGPPDENSNLRPYVRCIRPGESSLEMRLRLEQDQVEQWNQEFWSRHNKRFFDERNDFIQLHKLSGTEELTANQMSEFYKMFLDKNKRLHLYYNISWYIKNFNLLMLALQVKLVGLFPQRTLPKT